MNIKEQLGSDRTKVFAVVDAMGGIAALGRLDGLPGHPSQVQAVDVAVTDHDIYVVDIPAALAAADLTQVRQNTRFTMEGGQPRLVVLNEGADS